MSLGILNNIAALYAQNNLSTTQSNLQNTLQQLSSGSRINSGADDAAGLAVADGLHANEAALNQSSQNATSGIGLLQTADGALSQVTNLLDRAVTLATESANGTLTGAQVSSANQEYQNILTQIGNIGSHTNFNSTNVFSSKATNIVVTDGTSSGLNTYADTIGKLTTSSVGTTAPTDVTPSTVTAALAGNQQSATVTLGGSSDTFSGSVSLAVGMGAANKLTVTNGSSIASAVSQMQTQLTSAGVSDVTVAQGTGNAANTIVFTSTGGSDLAFTSSSLSDTPSAATTGAGADFTDKGVATLTADSAATVLTTVTAAIGDVAYQRGTLGADINQLTSASNVASAESVNLTSAEQSIRATNYGQAASDLSKFQILSQTGISALAQANSVQQEVLKLLQ